MSGACAINAKQRLRLLFLLGISLTLAACGGANNAGPTNTPAPTSTPRATPLPTVATLVPPGSASRPLEIALVPPPTSSETGTALISFLNDRTGLTFKLNIAQSDADVLAALCGPTPTFAWADGLTLLAAIEQGCGTVALRVKQGDATGIKSDIVVNPSGTGIDSLVALRLRAKSREFCRVDDQDIAGWILPVIMMRAPNFHPLDAFKDVKDYGDANSMLQDVYASKCIAAIPSGTLSDYKTATGDDISKVVRAIATSPELPFGGLVISPAVPHDVAVTVTKLFTDHSDQLQNLVTADALVPATNADFADVQRAFDAVGENLVALGR